VKVGFDAKRDARRIRRIVKAVPETVSFRVDANQGYNLDEARQFLDAAPTDQLQLVEQPLPVGRLSDHASLRMEYDTTLMLDEEINNGDDLRDAAAADAADAVKFKLMKIGGWKSTERRIKQARDLGFEVVLGNGVQSDIGCIHEAAIWRATNLELAGEFNGWRKQKQALTNGRLHFDDGALTWDGGSISLDYERVDAHTLDRERFATVN
jgi:L-alanine-DL-glutamate epimerase-like enolase superfamily enzyme